MNFEVSKSEGKAIHVKKCLPPVKVSLVGFCVIMFLVVVSLIMLELEDLGFIVDSTLSGRENIQSAITKFK